MSQYCVHALCLVHKTVLRARFIIMKSIPVTPRMRPTTNAAASPPVPTWSFHLSRPSAVCTGRICSIYRRRSMVRKTLIKSKTFHKANGQASCFLLASFSLHVTSPIYRYRTIALNFFRNTRYLICSYLNGRLLKRPSFKKISRIHTISQHSRRPPRVLRQRLRPLQHRRPSRLLQESPLHHQ